MMNEDEKAEHQLKSDMDKGLVPYVIRKKTGQRLPTFFEVLDELSIENHSELEDEDMLRVVSAGLGYMFAEAVQAILEAKDKPTIH